MYISVNKKTNNRRPVKYAALNSALSGASTSGVWYDEEAAATAPRRTNRIKLTRSKQASSEDYDA
jgi:hypothetical protein